MNPVQICPQASARELRCVQIASILSFGVLSMVIALTSTQIYALFAFAADLVYVVVFPQLTAILYLRPWCSDLGVALGLTTGVILRIGAGEDIGLPTWIYFWGWSEESGQLFPFRTFAMLANLCVTLVVSWLWRRYNERIESVVYVVNAGSSSTDPVISQEEEEGGRGEEGLKQKEEIEGERELCRSDLSQGETGQTLEMGSLIPSAVRQGGE